MTEVARIFAPLLVWLALFSGVYGLHGLGCGLGWPEVGLGALSLHRAALLGGWAGSIAVQALVLAALAGPFGSRCGFVRGISLALAVAGLPAVVWTLAPVALTSSCV